MSGINPLFRALKSDQLSEEEEDKARLFLRQLSVGEVFKIWFGKNYIPQEIQNTVPTLRTKYPTRKSLLQWLHGTSTKVAADLLFVRMSSPEKKRLVGLVLTSCRPKFPWLTSRIINVMAFRPRFFEKRVATPDKPYGQIWGPLYHRVSVPKGRSKRYLWIPNPPLKRVQKSLLRLLESPIRHKLHDYCLGTISHAETSNGKFVPLTIFENAERHLHQKVILTFDIRDFFSSTRLSDVIIGLQHINERQSQMVIAKELPHYLHGSKAICDLEWKKDCELLVGKLATCRGRLPQGAPTSPIFADVAFARFDKEIFARLKDCFGTTGFAYSRYYDDLTISISSMPAGRQPPSELLTRCNALIENVLKGSSYQLQSRKSKGSYTANGHNVTGLVVRRDTIELPRSLKRYLRSVIWHLNSQPFVIAARRWAQIKQLEKPVFNSILRGHRWQHDGRNSKASAERLSVLMLRHFYPDLRIERLLTDWYPWQKVVKSDESIIQSKSVWRIVEWLLSALWNGEISMRASQEGDSLIFTQSGEPICRVIAETNHAFFFLERDTAIEIVRYWHHLKGLYGFLHACPNKPCFKRILGLRDQLSQCLDTIRIDPISKIEDGQVNFDEPRPDTITMRFTDLCLKVSKEYKEFARRLECNHGSNIIPSIEAFCRQSINSQDFMNWLKATYELFIIRLRYLPSGNLLAKVSFDDRELFDYIKLKTECFLGLISPHYKVIKDFEKKIGYTKESPNSVPMVQLIILESLHNLFTQTTIRRREQEGSNTSWQEELLPNDLWEGLDTQYDNEYLRFCNLHYQLRTSGNITRLFVKTSENEILSKREVLRRKTKNDNSDECWGQLQVFGKALDLLTREQIEDCWCNSSPSKEDPVFSTIDWRRRKIWEYLTENNTDTPEVFRLIKHLRNRDSHGANPERRKDWVTIQKSVGKLLGRSWISRKGTEHPAYYADDDLELYPFETDRIRLLILRGVNDLLDNTLRLSLDQIKF